MSHRAVVCVGLACFAVGCDTCGRAPIESTRSAQAPPASVASTSPTATNAAPRASAQPETAPASLRAREASVLAVTLAWNDALADHDVSALARVYGDEVLVYGKLVKKQAAIAQKAAAFAAAPDYTQSIGTINVDWGTPSRPRAVFEKRWRQHGAPGVTTGSLTFREDGGDPVIVAESDVTTDRMLGRTDTGDCHAAVVNLMRATRLGSQLLNGPKNPDAGHVSNGLRVYPGDWPMYDVAIHETHPDHLATLAWFNVDVSKPTVRLAFGNDALQPLDPALAAAVKKACAHEAHD